MENLDLNVFDYTLPEGLIASAPAERRDASRLLVLDRASGRVAHKTFADLPDLLRAGDCVVLNRTKVLKARIVGKKRSGGRAELLLLSPHDGTPRQWRALARGLATGSSLELAGGLRCEVMGKTPEGEWLCSFPTDNLLSYLEVHGAMPLPPYILKQRKRLGAACPDDERYQTVYAQVPGSVAAPTAGLHFTDEVLKRLKAKGVDVAFVTLHIGWGTFRPILTQNILDHKMLPEAFEIDSATASQILMARRRGGRVVSVGTSTTRALETASKGERLAAMKGMADIFIYPGHRYRAVDALVTNFHLPKSTPLLLAAAFAGPDKLLPAYQEAIAQKYRFYSYGDAMLVV